MMNVAVRTNDRFVSVEFVLRRTKPLASRRVTQVIEKAATHDERPFSATAATNVRRSKRVPADNSTVPQTVVDLRRIAVMMLNLGGHPLECTRSHLENIIWDGNADGHSVVDVFESTTSGRKSIAADVDADGKVCQFRNRVSYCRMLNEVRLYVA